MAGNIKFTYNDETNSLIVNDNGNINVFKLDKYSKIFRYILKAIDCLDGEESEDTLTPYLRLSFDSSVNVSQEICTLSNINPTTAEVHPSIGPFEFGGEFLSGSTYGFLGNQIDFEELVPESEWPPEITTIYDFTVRITIDGVKYTGKFINESEYPGDLMLLPIGKWTDNDKIAYPDYLETYNELGWDNYPFRLTNEEIDKDGHRAFLLFILEPNNTAEHSVTIELCFNNEENS